MGLFCVSFHVRSSPFDELSAELNRQGLTQTIVLPTKNGWTSFYEAGASNQDVARIHDIGTRVSLGLSREVAAFLVHDSDFACYWLFDNGQQVDSFNSCPGYFDDSDETTDARGGAAEILVRYCRPGTSPEKIRKVLSSETVFAEQTVEQLADMLGIPSDHAVRDYGDMAEGNDPGELEDRDDDCDDGSDGDGSRWSLNDGTDDDSRGTEPRDVIPLFERLLGQRQSTELGKPTDMQAQRLINAAATGDLETLQQLLDDGVSPDTEAVSPMPKQVTPAAAAFLGELPAMSVLLAAVMNGQTAATQCLLKHGANPNYLHPLFGSPSHTAASAGDSEILRLLIDAGADLQQSSLQGLTPRQTISNVRAAWAQFNAMQSSIKELGIQLPELSPQISDMAKLESGWSLCEALIDDSHPKIKL